MRGDAGSTIVRITVPEEVGEILTIEDDGTGMSAAEFRNNG